MQCEPGMADFPPIAREADDPADSGPFGLAPSPVKADSNGMDDDWYGSEMTAGLSSMMSASGSAGTEPLFSERTTPFIAHQLTLANILDIFSICSRSLPVLRAALDAMSRPAGRRRR